ncbi:exodeoxyribonuclease VII large subunit, partial [Gaiella sp.]|uniref:exodeoxyribonuclease VII large subunit n=1 Tax=Gaiella sp. TaxID=2663207 RepID=UPI002E362509
RKVYSVSAFNKRLAGYVGRVRDVWVEGEVAELRRNPAWATVFVTLKDAKTGACLPTTMQRRRFDAIEPLLAEGERVQANGGLELYEARGELSFRATAIERVGAGDHAARLAELKRKLAAEGLFAPERKRPLPRFPRAVGLLTGADAAARGDVIAAITARYPAVRIVVAETRVQGPFAVGAITSTLARLAACEGVDVVVLARGGGSFEDLLPFSDERVVRAVAGCAVPVVSAVGHEQDEPLCDLAADVRAPTPTAAARLVVPDLDELRAGLDRARQRLDAATRRMFEAQRTRLDRGRDRLRAAPALLIERRRAALDRTAARLQALSPKATLARGYAIVRTRDGVLRDAALATPGARIDVELARGGLGARVEDVRAR